MKLVSSIYIALFCCTVATLGLSLNLHKSEKQISKKQDQDNVNDDIFLSGGHTLYAGGELSQPKENNINCSETSLTRSDANEVEVANEDEEDLFQFNRGSFSIKDPHTLKNQSSSSQNAGKKNNDLENCNDVPGLKCVPYYQCKNGSIITVGDGLIDIQLGFPPLPVSPFPNPCPGFLDFCCKDPSYIPISPQQNPEDNELIPEDNENQEVKITTAVENCSDKPGHVCVPYYQCEKNGSIITENTSGLIGIQIGFPKELPGEICPEFLDVCCKDHVPTPPRPNYESKCGKRNSYGLVNQTQELKKGESLFGEWPSMCAVFSEENGQKVYQCGASLLDTNVLLTAAHCVNRFSSMEKRLFVRCGDWDLENENEPFEPYPHQELEVKQVHIHPEFNAQNLAFDFSVLMTSSGGSIKNVNEHFVLDYNIDTICLPKPDMKFRHQTCYAMGWGKDKFGKDGSFQAVLKEVEIRTMDHSDCQDSLRSTRLGSRFQLHDSFLCAGGEPGKDTCQGDGGSPLMCSSFHGETGYSYFQAGIVSWGIGCGGSTPGVYASVDKAVCWIDMVTSCHANSQSNHSHFGYLASECGSWESETKKRLKSLPARIGSFLEDLYNFDECRVPYEE